MINKKKIGNSEIHPIGIGTWEIGGGIHREEGIIFADYDNEEKEIAAIKYSVQKGQNHIDTAQMYSAGHSEEVVGKAIKGIDRKKLFIASKIWKSHARKSSVVPAVEGMLKRLQVDYLNLVYMHSPSVPEPMEEYMGGLNEAVDKGLVKYIGVSNFHLEQLKQAVSISKYSIVANQMHYNLIHKQDVPQDMKDFCKKKNIMIVAYRPIERRLLADQATNDTILAISKKYKRTPAQIALNWLISQDNVVAIPKAVNKKHIDENLGASDFELKNDDVEKLNSLPDIEE